MKGFVYIIQSIKSGLFYIGSSENPVKRLEQHNSGLVVATKNKGHWELRFFQEYDNMTVARKIEYKLKKLKRRDILEKIIEDKIIKLKDGV
ncbi:MAG: GIY-YIG nuclease family protein [Patescibacteria group bacterium]